MDPIEDLGFVKVDLLRRPGGYPTTPEAANGYGDRPERVTPDDDTSIEDNTFEAILAAIIKAGPRLSSDARRRIRAIVEEASPDR